MEIGFDDLLYMREMKRGRREREGGKEGEREREKEEERKENK